MKRILAILILVSLLVQCMAHYSVVALFELRRDYIARNLCENRDKPQMKCCGKCFLKKQLKKVNEDNSPSDSQSKNIKAEYTAYIIPQWHYILRPYNDVVAKIYNPVYQRMIGCAIYTSIFHPPSC